MDKMSVAESEVTCMEQVRYFLAEYSGWISMAASGLTILLIAVVLHRIKKVGKQIRESATEIGIVLEFAKRSAENEKAAAVSGQLPGGADNISMSAGAVPGESTGELIDAVLEEVFP